MLCVRNLLTLALSLSAGVCAQAQVINEASSSSSVRLEILPSGYVHTHVRNSTHQVVYWFGAQARLQPILVTMTTEVKRGTDGEGVDPASTVSFTVDDVSQAGRVRVTAFSDPGAIGAILGEYYAVATMPGCCANPTTHRVRFLRTGRLLFESTGSGRAGAAAWGTIGNPASRTHWASFNGDINADQNKHGIVGVLSFGNDQGPLSRIAVIAKGGTQDADDQYMFFTRAAELFWIDPNKWKPPRDRRLRPDSADASDDPAWLPQIDEKHLALFVDGREIAVLPVSPNGLDLAGATVDQKFILAMATP